MKKYILFLILFIISCNKEYPIKPKYVDLSDWHPNIEITKNNYNRIELQIDSIPPIKDQRNILEFVAETRQGNEEYAPTFTIDNLIGFWYDSFVSAPLFEKGQSYDLRIRCKFVENEDMLTNSVSFTSMDYQGEILEEISYPKSESCFDGMPSYYFYDGDLFCFSCNSELKKYDKASKQFIDWQMTNKFQYSDRVLKSGNVIISGYISGYYNSDSIYYTYLNPTTGLTDSIIGADYGGYQYVTINDIFLHQDFLYLIREFYYDDSTQVLKIDPVSRKIIEKHTFGDDFKFQDFCSDNEDIWVLCSDSYFNSKMARFDLENYEIIQPEYSIPVYSSETLKWDGENFWVQSFYDRKYVKFKYGEITE